MRIAIAGAGSLAKYFTDEFPQAGHDIVILTRSHKPHFDGVPGVVEQRITDYSSVDQLVGYLQDCDAVVTTVLDYSPAITELHLALAKACRKSTKCKRFIPSEFGANLETHPHFAHPFLHPVMDLLRSQTEVEWTTLAIGWLADYLVPSKNRYHPDIGPMHPLDHSTEKMTIPGDGKYPVGVVSARDFAKALASILASEKKWRHVIHVQADRKSWLEMAELVKTDVGIPQLTVELEDLAPYQKISENPDAPLEDTLLAFMKLFAASGGADFDQQTIEHDRADYFPKVRLRTVQELLKDVKNAPDAVL